MKATVIPSPERLQETQLGALGVPSRGLIYKYNATNVRKRDDSYDRVVHETRQETRHHDSCYVIHYITVRHSESYLDTTDITTPRPPVWPYPYVSVDHAASRRYGRYHHPPIRLEPDHGRRRESVGNGWVRERGRCRRGHVARRWEPRLAGC